MAQQYSNTQFGNSQLMMASIKESPYKTMGALAELIDNSLDAGADLIQLIALDTEAETTGGKRVQRLDKIAVLDNGEGMDPQTIQECLSIGFSAGRGGRDQIGKFGYGMSVGSLTQTWRFEVYSWQDNGPIYHTYVDYNEMMERADNSLPAVVEIPKKEIPIIGQMQLMQKYKIGESGTMVLWSKLDFEKVRILTSRGIMDRFHNDLSRIYRHFLDDNDDYGKKRDIEVVHINSIGAEEARKPLLANDPIYLLTPNTLPIVDGVDFSVEQTNQIHSERSFMCPYVDNNGEKKESEVKITFTYAKPSIRAIGGASELGKHYKRNNGISFIRAGREIEMSDFNLVNRYDTTERWWGCEVRFSPELDKVFGVANDKQHINNIYGYDDANPPPLFGEEDHDDSIWLNHELNKIFDEEQGQIRNHLKATKTTRGPRKKNKATTEERVNAAIKLDPMQEPSESKKEGEKKTRDQKVEEITQILIETDKDKSVAEATQEAELKVDWETDFITKDWAGNTFLDRVIVGGGVQAQVNIRHKFYQVFFSKIEDNIESDPMPHEALKIIFMAYAKAEDELWRLDPKREIFPALRDRWGYWTEQLIKIADD